MFETSNRSMPLSSQSLFQVLLIELTFMVQKISSIRSISLNTCQTPRLKLGIYCAMCLGLHQQQVNKRNWSNTCIGICPRGMHICTTEGSRITPYGWKKEMEAAAQEELFAPCKRLWALACVLGGAVWLAKPSLSAVRCFQGGCRRGTVITEYRLKME